MPVTINLPGPLRVFAGGHGAVTLEGSPATVGQALDLLWAVCPGVRDRVLTEQGLVREHIGVFADKEDIRHTEGLATPVGRDTEIWIVPSVSGG